MKSHGNSDWCSSFQWSTDAGVLTEFCHVGGSLRALSRGDSGVISGISWVGCVFRMGTHPPGCAQGVPRRLFQGFLQVDSIRCNLQHCRFREIWLWSLSPWRSLTGLPLFHITLGQYSSTWTPNALRLCSPRLWREWFLRILNLFLMAPVPGRGLERKSSRFLVYCNSGYGAWEDSLSPPEE